MKSNTINRLIAGRAWLLRLVLAGLALGWFRLGIADESELVMVAVEDLDGIGVVIELPTDLEKNASQFGGFIFPGLNIVDEYGGATSDNGTREHLSNFKIDPFWHFLGVWVLGFAIFYFWEPFWTSTRYWWREFRNG